MEKQLKLPHPSEIQLRLRESLSSAGWLAGGYGSEFRKG